MPNPFDQFDAATSNPFDQFDPDPVHQIPGLENSADSSANVGKDDSSLWEKYVGANEAGLTALTGMPAMVLGGAAGLGNDETAGKISEKLTYQPTTEKGKDYAKELGDFTNRYLNPLLGGLGEIHLPENIKDIKKTDPTLAKIIERDAKEKTAAKPVNPFDQFDEGAAVVDDPFAQMKRQLDTPQTNEGPFIDPEVLRERQIPEQVMGQAVDHLSEIPAREADAAAAARQAQTELDVKRQATLDYNAAERARQENAGIPEDRAVPEGTPDETRQYNDMLLSKMDEEKPTSGTPAFFKEPDANLPNPPMRVKRGQRGAINPEVFQEGFQKLKRLADGTWLRAHSDGRVFSITAIKDSREQGRVDFIKPAGDETKVNLKSDWTSVNKDARRQGLATEMYKFASDLGNDIKKSSEISEDGKDMWKSFEEKGLAQRGTMKSPGNKQRGAVLLGKDPITEQLRKIPGFEKAGENSIPVDPSPADVIKAGLEYGKDNPSISKNLDSGAYMRYLKSKGNGLLLGVAHIVQNMGKRTDLQYRQVVLPLEQAVRKLSMGEVSTLVNLLKLEDAQKARFSPENIMAHLTVKQQVAYAHFRNAMDYLHTVQNGIRELNGMPSVTKIEGYVAHMFDGDFRRPVYQAVLGKDGNPRFDENSMPQKKLVAYLASDTRYGLNKQAAAMKEKFPDLEIDPKNDHTIRFYGRNTDFEGAYSKIIDFLGRDDPAVARIQQYMEDLQTAKAGNLFDQKKHFEERAGVSGWVGTRPGMDPKAEALAFLEEQVKYMKNGIKWFEAQKTTAAMKEILNNPDLREQQPKNMEWARDYWKNATGFGTDAAVAAAQDALRYLGTSPTLWAKGANGLKSYFVLDKIAGSLGFVAAQGLQTANVLPHITDLISQGYKGNPVTALAVGIPAGMVMAGMHFARSGDAAGKFIEGLGTNHFLNRAFKYAEDNGVITKSVNDEAPIGTSFKALPAIGNAASKTISSSEAFVRGAAYMSFVQLLKDSGKFTDDAALFQMAEDRTHAAMVDYRQSERPMMFSKLGIGGGMLNVFQTWGINWYNQFSFAAREGASGNVAPFIAMTMLAYANGGIMNVPYMADLDKLYDFLKQHIPSTNLWMKVRDDPFWRDPKMWMADNFGESSVWGAVSTHNPWGVSVASRVTAPTPSEMLQSPGGMVVDFAHKIGSAAHAITHPTDPTAWKQFGMDMTPVAAKGLVETSKPMEGTAYNTKTYDDGTKGYVVGKTTDMGSHTGVYTRDQHDQDVRPLGFKTQKEVSEREVAYRLSKDEQQVNERSKGLVDEFYNALKNGDRSKMEEYEKVHTTLTGKAIDRDAIEQKLINDYTDTMQRAGLKAGKSVASIQGYARAKQLLDDFKANRK